MQLCPSAPPPAPAAMALSQCRLPAAPACARGPQKGPLVGAPPPQLPAQLDAPAAPQDTRSTRSSSSPARSTPKGLALWAAAEGCEAASGQRRWSMGQQFWRPGARCCCKTRGTSLVLTSPTFCWRSCTLLLLLLLHEAGRQRAGALPRGRASRRRALSLLLRASCGAAANRAAF